MALLLVGDIGGTKTLLRLVAESEGSAGEMQYERRYASDRFSHLVPMVREFFAAAAESLGDRPAPQCACFAIAGPVVGDTCTLTNLNWTLEARQLEKDLQIPKIRLINDFAAVGYGILGLKEEDLCTLQNATPQTDGVQANLGAGTGLGQGFLIPCGGDYLVFASEGGHASFAPRNKREFQLQQYLRDRDNLDSVSVERVVSGQGIVAIYQYLRDRKIASELPEIAELVRTWEKDKNADCDPAAAISQAALDRRDRLCEETLQLFVAAYGAEAGNWALKTLPYGGLYLAGGIAAKILPLLQAGDFMQAFLQKGRMKPLLETIPVRVILNPQVGLLGAAICATRMR